MTTADEVMSQLSCAAIVAVVEIDDEHNAEPLADALVEGGVTALEVTFRTAAAGGAIAWIAEHHSELLVGAGTVLGPQEVQRAVDAGARFGVSPGTSVQVLEAAERAGLPFVPGVATSSDIQCCLEHGVTRLKFFPAGVLGGPAALSALSAPFSSYGVRFMPTGGVTSSSALEYLCLPSVFAVGGTWIARREAIAAARWEDIRAAAREAVSLVDRARASRG